MAMCEGVQKLLEAAQFLEQQEQLKLSPQQPAVQIAHINEQQQQFVVHCPPAATYEHNGTSGHHVNTNNNNNSSILSTRNSNTRHTNQVSSSAPAAGATFHHANGLTITSSGGNNVIAGLTNGSSGNSQLVAAAAAAAAATTNHHNNDYEFSNGNVGGGAAAIVATSAAAAAATINGRSSEGRMSEDAFSSHISTSTTSNPNTNSASIILLPTPANTTNNSHEQQGQLAALQQHHQQPNKATAYTLVDNSHIAIVSNAAASKQMLLNGGIRIKAPAATIGSFSSKAISIPSQQPSVAGGGGSSKLMSSSTSAFSQHSTSLPHSMPRHKSPNTLTPPPMASRKCAETHARIRSYSLSNKFPANQLHLHHNGSASNHMSMIVDDAHMSNSSSSNHSPPRHGLGMGGSASGGHYIQMTSAQQGGAGSQLTHVSSPIGGSGRRRTISSNSNGAGTREVHNKLEKNRRAHLKECYESLKNQLPLKEEDRKKTSNLSILGEALKYVKKLQGEGEDLDAQIEQEAKKKINAQKRIVSLKRELGPKYEQKFSGIFPDIELGSIPSERENLNDSVSLSSGRGSMLYSSSSSLSSGGSNTMSSPVGAGLQTAMPTAISPVISKTNSNSIINNHSSATSPISANMLQHLKSSASVSANNSSSAGSPTAILNGIVNVGCCPLSLTAKNISATSLTRGSPTPSTPSPSPSSSSGVSSSSSLISSSPPMNGVTNGRTVTVNIPNGLKFQTSGGATIGTIGNGTASAAATIIATTAPGNVVGGGSNSNNAIMLQALHLV